MIFPYISKKMGNGAPIWGLSVFFFFPLVASARCCSQQSVFCEALDDDFEESPRGWEVHSSLVVLFLFQQPMLWVFSFSVLVVRHPTIALACCLMPLKYIDTYYILHIHQLPNHHRRIIVEQSSLQTIFMFCSINQRESHNGVYLHILICIYIYIYKHVFRITCYCNYQRCHYHRIKRSKVWRNVWSLWFRCPKVSDTQPHDFLRLHSRRLQASPACWVQRLMKIINHPKIIQVRW